MLLRTLISLALPSIISLRVLAAPIEVIEAEPEIVNASTRYSTESVRQIESVSQRDSRDLRDAGRTESDNMSAELYVQFQRLQAEVQALRGLVEEQSYLIEQLSQKRLEDYLDLDRRIGELQSKIGNTAAVSKPTASVRAPVAATSSVKSSASTVRSIPDTKPVTAAKPATPPAVASSAPVAAAAAASEQARSAYSSAYQRLKQNDLGAAKTEFVAFVKTYPESDEVPNAYFWLGELYYVESDLENSRQAFTNLADGYPDHRKVPDAKFKLGKIYHQLGQNDKAKALLESVLTDYPNSKAANPASEYLKNSLR